MIVYKEELHTRIKPNTSFRVKYALFNEYVDFKGRTFNKFCLFFISKKIRGPPFWFELAKKQIKIGGITMKEERKYYIKLDDKQLVEVTKDIYTVYYQMRRRERYLEERDLKNGLIYYSSWDTEYMNGEELLVDKSGSIEDVIFNDMRYKAVVSFINENDKRDILKLSMLGKTEKQIAEIIGLNQSNVNRAKSKLYSELKKYLDNIFKI